MLANQVDHSLEQIEHVLGLADTDADDDARVVLVRQSDRDCGFDERWVDAGTE
jgi:hypothetical protein